MFKILVALSLGTASIFSFAEDEDNTMKSITLNTSVGELAANLYLPEGVEKPPVVIVTGAWTTVKEQMPAVYAKALAEKGYAAVTFDFRGWGQSEDAIRYLEDPTRKTQDIRAVIDAVAQLEQVDGKRTAGLGICASAGYMIDAVTGNDKVIAAALVAPWLHNVPMATAIYGGEESVKGLLATAASAIGNESVIEAASTTNESALMFNAPYYTETDRGLIPEYDNKYNLASWTGWLNYDAQINAVNLTQPTLMVASEAMALPAGAHQFLEAAGDNVDSVWFDGITQFEFYDQPEAVNKAVDAITKHFLANL